VCALQFVVIFIYLLINYVFNKQRLTDGERKHVPDMGYARYPFATHERGSH
jgi:hypothetical protein